MLTLFDFAAPIVHDCDPPTSAAAADRLTRTGARQRHAETVLAVVRRLPGRTAVELWDGCTDGERAELGEMQEVRRRLTDLQHAGHVVAGESRRCSVKGSSMVTWRAT